MAMATTIAAAVIANSSVRLGDGDVERVASGSVPSGKIWSLYGDLYYDEDDIAFLDHAPTSVRRGRAAVMLGRLLVGRGDRKTARAWFESASGDADPAVAAAGRAGIASLTP